MARGKKACCTVSRAEVNSRLFQSGIASTLRSTLFCCVPTRYRVDYYNQRTSFAALHMSACFGLGRANALNRFAIVEAGLGPSAVRREKIAGRARGTLFSDHAVIDLISSIIVRNARTHDEPIKERCDERSHARARPLTSTSKQFRLGKPRLSKSSPIRDFRSPSYWFAICCWSKLVVKLITRKLSNALFLPFFTTPKSLKLWRTQTLNPHFAISVP